jgi:hypothetical protein
MKIFYSVLAFFLLLVLIPCVAAIVIVGIIPFLIYLVIHRRYEYKESITVKPKKKENRAMDVIETFLNNWNTSVNADKI